MIALLDNALVFQNRQERKTIANFCSAALHFDLNFNVERLAVLIDWYINTMFMFMCALFRFGVIYLYKNTV